MMTTLVRGPIKLVTDRPDTVRKVSIRAPRLRLHGAGIVTDHNDDIPVVGGQVEFEALPGPAVLTLVTAGGAPLRSVDIVVPDEDTATLSECLDPVYTYDPPVVGRAQQFAREAGEHAARAEVLRDDTVAAAEHAETQAGVAAGHAAQTGEDRAQTGADRRQTGEDRAQTGKDAEAAEQWAAQSKDAATQAIAAAETVSQYRGTGFPEGKVSAPVGAIYTDTAATNGAIRWIKTSGTGTTGWALEYGDTGWRNITANNEIFGTVGEGGAVTIRRSGDVVTFRLLGPITADDRGRFEVRNISTRFTPAMRLYLPMATYDGTFKPQVTQYHFQISGQPAGQTIIRSQGNVEFTWTTTAAWPTTLPGIPA